MRFPHTDGSHIRRFSYVTAFTVVHYIRSLYWLGYVYVTLPHLPDTLCGCYVPTLLLPFTPRLIWLRTTFFVGPVGYRFDLDCAVAFTLRLDVLVTLGPGYDVAPLPRSHTPGHTVLLPLLPTVLGELRLRQFVDWHSPVITDSPQWVIPVVTFPIVVVRPQYARLTLT